jgi:hypothetical protein
MQVALTRGRLALALALVSACRDEADADDAWEPTSTDASTSAADVSTSGGSTSTDTTSSSGAADTSSGEDASSTGDDPPAAAFVRYPSDRVHSPVTAVLAQRWIALRAAHREQGDDVFMKVGASSDVSTSNMHCFAGPDWDLGEHDELGDTLAWFLAGDAAGATPYDRDSLATESGRSASWAIAGDPSPLQAEIDAIAPGLALVHYGTNDMGLGIDPGTAMPGFFESMSTLMDTLDHQGVVAILVGLTKRADDPDADLWIPTYNAVLRALAQQRQVPFVDVWRAVDPLPDHGLGGDGLHLRADPDGACLLDAPGLQYGYNMRNLIQLEVLDRMRAALADADDAPDPDVLPPVQGDGSSAAPWIVDTLPFLHDGDTRDGTPAVDLYDCSPADRSGPELVYELTVDAPTPVRIIALDREGVDVDVHLLDDAGSCVARDDRLIAGTLPVGTRRIAIDSWSDGAADYPGAYVLVVVPCEPTDSACTEPL